MKKLYIALALALAVAAQAQDIPCKITKSAVFKDEYKNSNIVAVEDDGRGGVVIVRNFYGGVFSSGAGYYFEHYNEQMQLVKEFEYDQKRSAVLGVLINNETAHIIGFNYDKERKGYICAAHTASITDFKFSTRELFFLKSEEIERFSLFSGGYDHDSGAQMIINEDKSAFAVTVDIVNKNQETHKLFLFDNNAQQKFSHDFKRDIKDKKFHYENIDVSKDGNTLYLLGKVYTTEKKKKKEGGKYQYELTRISQQGAQTQAFDTDEHFAASLKTIVFDDRITCVGFYSDRNDNRFKGLSYFELDPTTLAIRKSKFNPFTPQFVLDKYGKDKQKELKNLSFRGMYISPGGEIVFNAEEYYVVTSTMTSPNGGTTTRTTYHYDDIVSAKFNREGELLWARNINKRQATGGDNPYISYSSTLHGNDTYFFINAGEKVKKLKNDRIQFGQTSNKKSNLNVIRINQEGDFEYKELLDDKDNDVPFMVSDGASTNDAIYFIGRKGKKKQLLKITLT